MALATILSITTNWTARADNSKCWGYNKDDTERPDISCTALTEGFLVSMQGATRAEVLKAMNAPGRPIDGGLHFISNYARGSKGFTGDVNFIFKDGSVAIIFGLIDGPEDDSNMEYIWNATLGGCSDFPDSQNRCNRR